MDKLVILAFCLVFFLIWGALVMLEEWWQGPFTDWWDRKIREHKNKKET